MDTIQTTINGTLRVFQDVQKRHAKRMVKIMEQLLRFPDEYLLLDEIVAEEREKRREDYDAIMNSTEVAKSTGTKRMTFDVLAREITDDTVVYFIQRQVQKLKDIQGL